MKQLNNKYIDNLVHKEELSDKELQELLKARDKGIVDFFLIDVREVSEFEELHIVKTDKLLPKSKFNEWFPDLKSKKEENLIIYCRSGNRSYQVQQVLLKYGFKSVSNLTDGIIDYTGDVESGSI